MKTKILIGLIIIILSSLFNYVKAAETAVFYEEFEGSLENWDLQKGWSVVSENGNRVLQSTQHSFAEAFLEGTADKLELKLKLKEGAVHFNIRTKYQETGQSRYLVGFRNQNSYLQKETLGKFQFLEESDNGISLNEWHNIKIEIKQNLINVFVDGRLTLSAEDKNFLKEGGVSFEALEDSRAFIDDVRAEMVIPEAREFQASVLFPDGVHKGDIILEGRDFLILENGKFEQFGNIYLRNSSKLIIRNSTFKITRYERLLNHWRIHLTDKSSLEIESSKLIPGKDPVSGEPTLFVVEAGGQARVSMKNSPTKLHLFTIFDNAKAIVENSEIVGEIGGLIGVFNKADVKIFNSRVGAVNLHIPSGASFEAEGLRTGFFEKWNLHEDAKVSGIGYDITLINTELVEDKIGPGPFERGWPVFIESDANVKIKNSQLRKVVITLSNEKAEFVNLFLEKPTDFRYRNINLENVVVKGQWGIFLRGSSDVIVRDSDAFWTFIYDDSKLKLVNTHMNEFDPRNFRGEMIFENSRWDTAAEILEDNDFTMRGSLEIRPIGGFSWEDSKVKRIYDVIGKPGAELTLTKKDEVIWSGVLDEEGKTSFPLDFDDATFNDSWILKDNLGHIQEVTFFSKTPIDMEQGAISKFISKIRQKMSSGPPPAPIKFITLIVGLIILATIIFFLRKKYFQKRAI